MSKWDMVKLGDVVTLLNGRAYKQDELLDKGATPVLRVGNFFSNRGWYYSDLQLEENKYCDKGDLLYAWSASFGPKIWDGPRAIYHYHIWKIVLSEHVEKEYMYHLLQQSTKEIMNQGRGIAMIHATKGGMEKMLIPLPPLETQKQISKTLDTSAKLLAMRKQQLSELDNLIKSTFYDMFGDPVANEKGWELVKIGDTGKLSSGGTPTRTNPNYFLGDINWYSAGELNQRYLIESKEKLSSEAIKNSAAKVFLKGSMLIGMYDTAAFKLGILSKNASSNQACANINVNRDMINIEWLYDCAQIMRPFFLNSRRGVRQKNLNLGMIKSFEIPLPPLSLQNQFAAIVTQIEEQKNLVKKAIDETQHLFDSLMSEYFE